MINIDGHTHTKETIQSQKEQQFIILGTDYFYFDYFQHDE